MTFGHRHPTGVQEFYGLVEGTFRIKLEDEILHMIAPSASRVHCDKFRAIRADGHATAVFVVAGTIDYPNATEFAPDFWPEDD